MCTSAPPGDTRALDMINGVGVLGRCVTEGGRVEIIVDMDAFSTTSKGVRQGRNRNATYSYSDKRLLHLREMRSGKNKPYTRISGSHDAYLEFAGFNGEALAYWARGNSCT